MAILPILQPSRVTVMIKPVGALCNLDCTYCYYLPTKTIYDGREHRMTAATLESVFASVLPRFTDHVTMAWQGGEPTLAGLDFFRQAMAFQEKYRRPQQQVMHALQTNGTLLDDDWCAFLRQHEYLVGLSLDGPPRFHDHYRLSNRGAGTAAQVQRGLRLLQKHAVDYNILCVLNDVNVHHPDEVFHYLVNLGSRWLQFIPAIEWIKDPTQPGRNMLAPYAPRPADVGKFLCRTFDLWFERHRAHISIREIDAVLNKLVLGQTPYCILDGACHNQLTIEHDGAVFGCDHFVERRWQHAQIGQPAWANSIRLDGSAGVGLTVHGSGYQNNAQLPGRDIDAAGDVATTAADLPGIDATWYDRIDLQRLGTFALRKQHLPEKCQACQWKTFCHGGCPKHRPMGGEEPEPTVLCEAYLAFFAHAMPRLQWLAGYLRKGQQPPEPGEPATTATDGSGSIARPRAGVSQQARMPYDAVGRNDPCPCGSGLKFKKCHGRKG